MILSSNDLIDGVLLPKQFGCDSLGIFPELHWADFPPETKSFAIIVRDPDAPSGTFLHWLVCNIPAKVTSIPQGGELPVQAVKIRNSSGTIDYIAPCPPKGIHRYYFTVIALAEEKLDCKNAAEFLQQVEKNKLASAEILCPFKRK